MAFQRAVDAVAGHLRIARRHVNAVLGSEFKYQEHFLTNRSLALALSQSGETADIIEGVNAALIVGLIWLDWPSRAMVGA